MAARAPGAGQGRGLDVGAAARRRIARSCRALAVSVRAAAGRPTFGHTLLEAATPAGLEGVTVWLAEVAQSALDIVLVVDEADRLPAATRDALAYLLRNAPPNLRAVVAARADCHLEIDDLINYGGATRIGPSRADLPPRRDDRAGARAFRHAGRSRHRRAPARAGRGLAARPAARHVGHGHRRRPAGGGVGAVDAGRGAARPLRQPAAGQPRCAPTSPS